MVRYLPWRRPRLCSAVRCGQSLPVQRTPLVLGGSGPLRATYLLGRYLRYYGQAPSRAYAQSPPSLAEAQVACWWREGTRSSVICTTPSAAHSQPSIWLCHCFRRIYRPTAIRRCGLPAARNSPLLVRIGALGSLQPSRGDIDCDDTPARTKHARRAARATLASAVRLHVRQPTERRTIPLHHAKSSPAYRHRHQLSHKPPRASTDVAPWLREISGPRPSLRRPMAAARK